ncbi:HPr kinase/phosphorylase [Parapedobacter pyrenivorans]|uniref:HPr kinase/phosphorylase n=1 Tax=Parapedobacter pyrenivorans TaxID=1305674 RepID=UPI00333F8D5D
MMWMKRDGLCSRTLQSSTVLQLTEYFDSLLSLFEALPMYTTDRLSLAGRIVELRTPSVALRSRFLPALSHLLVDEENDGAELTIWYAEDKDLARKVTAPPWPGFNAQGFHEGLDQEAVQLFFQPWQRQVFLYSRSKRTGIYWAQTAADVPWWEATFSFRILFHFWTRDLPAQLVHAGAVAKNGEGVLITGPSGSGKSTSCLNLLRAGYEYLGDDYVWVELGGSPRVHTLYQTAKVEPHNLRERFSDWMPRVINTEAVGQQKAIFHVGELYPKSLIKSATLQAILLPTVANQVASTLTEARPSETLLAMAPTTLHHLPHHRQVAYQKLRDISAAIPGFRWQLGADKQQFEASIQQLLAHELS